MKKNRHPFTIKLISTFTLLNWDFAERGDHSEINVHYAPSQPGSGPLFSLLLSDFGKSLVKHGAVMQVSRVFFNFHSNKDH